jgi:sulfite exporter TauE/SafE
MKPLLRTALIITGIYLILLGILYLFAPSTAELLLRVPLPDRATAMIYGVANLAVASLCLTAVFHNQITKNEHRFLLTFCGLHGLLFGLFVPLGIYSPAQAVPPSLIWGVLNGLLVFGGRNKSSLSAT